MSASLAELILHPVRLQIVHALGAGGESTAQQLAARLDQVTHATLYRHLKALVDGGVLHVVGERPVRGATERMYALAHPPTVFAHGDLAAADVDAHRRYFAAFIAGLLAEFERSLRQPDVALSPTGIAYRLSLLWATDTEYQELSQQLTEILAAARKRGPAPGRRLRRLSMVVIPESESGEQATEAPGEVGK